MSEGVLTSVSVCMRSCMCDKISSCIWCALKFAGHVTVGGSICMQMLTRSGWSPSNDIEVCMDTKLIETFPMYYFEFHCCFSLPLHSEHPGADQIGDYVRLKCSSGQQQPSERLF